MFVQMFKSQLFPPAFPRNFPSSPLRPTAPGPGAPGATAQQRGEKDASDPCVGEQGGEGAEITRRTGWCMLVVWKKMWGFNGVNDG